MQPLNKILVIFDIDDNKLLNNLVFDRNFSLSISHTYESICYLYDTFKKINFDFITPDIYFEEKSFFRQYSHIFCITTLQSNYTKKLLTDDKIVPLLLICFESPFIATKFYLNLKKISSKYLNSMVFSGMRKMLSHNTKYKQSFFPQSYNIKDFNSKSFAEKKFITMVTGAKSIGNWKKNILLKLVYGFGVKEIYKERLKVVNFFSNKDGFDLYGRGWDKATFKQKDRENINKVYKGEVEDKFQTLKNYKFTFCFENSIFPGYVTEKIFDAMLAGSVPIYLGAPDIEKYVDKGAFIDMRDFKNYEQLYNYLLKIDETVYQKYLENIKKYIVLDKYKKFNQEYFSDEILKIIQNEIKNYA